MADDEGAVGAVLKWQSELALDIGRSRAARARLRRCVTIMEALLEPSTIDLIKRIRGTGDALPRGADERLALLAIALARCDGGRGGPSFAAVLGRTPVGKPPSDNDRARFSPIRFRALIQAARDHDWEHLARALRRALTILGDAPFDTRRFVRELLYLDDHVLQRWTYEYWQTRPPSDFQELSESASLQDTETET